MIVKISEELLSYIRNSNYDEETQNFLIRALLLEGKRDKEDIKNYTSDYEDIISDYIRG